MLSSLVAKWKQRNENKSVISDKDDGQRSFTARSLPPLPLINLLKMSVDASNLKGRDEATQQKRYEALKGRNALILSGSMFVEFMSGGMMDQFRCVG